MIKKTIEEVATWALENTEFELLPNQIYRGNRGSLNFKCNQGHTFPSCWKYIEQGQGCKFCRVESQRKTITEVENWITHHTRFKLLPHQTYLNSSATLAFTCEKGHTFHTCWDRLKQGKGCSHCWEVTIDKIILWGEDKPLSLFPLDQVYTGNASPLKWKCKSDERHIWESNWHDIQQGKGCPKCRNKAETLLGSLLAEEFKVEPQFKIPCPKGVRKSGEIRVDFYLPEINTVVEYHGEQHYRWVPFFHKTEKLFKAQQVRDQWLRDYCSEKGISYLEVSNEEFNHNFIELPNKIKIMGEERVQ